MTIFVMSLKTTSYPLMFCFFFSFEPIGLKENTYAKKIETYEGGCDP